MACGTSLLLYLHRYTFAVIKPKLVKEWGLGKDELGLLDGAFSLCYTACQFPLGIATDVFGVRLLLTSMIVLWSIGLGMHAWAPLPKYLWFARAVLGIGQSGVLSAQSRITRTWFPLSQRTTVQGWIGVFFARFGGLSANVLVGTLLIGLWGLPWRTAVYIMMGVGLAHALLFALWFRNTPKSHPRVNPAEVALIAESDAERSFSASPARLSVGQLFRRMSFRSIVNLLMVNLQLVLSTLADNIFSAWIPLFLAEVHGLNFQEMGIYSALPLAGGGLGGAMGGWLNDTIIRATGSRRWSRSLIGLAGKGVAGLLLLAALGWYDAPRLFCVMLFFVKFFSDWSLTTTWGTVTDIGGEHSATVFAFNNSVAGIGAVVGSVLYGFIAEDFGWWPVFVTGAMTYFACAASWLFINCQIPVLSETSATD